MELQVKEQPGGHRTILGGLSPALSTVLHETSKELSYPSLQLRAMPVIGAFVLASEKEWSRCGEQKQSAVTRPTKLQGNPAKRASLRNGMVMAVS